ncbi:hypothetical protein RB195_012719 [Necator americanus]
MLLFFPVVLSVVAVQSLPVVDKSTSSNLRLHESHSVHPRSEFDDDELSSILESHPLQTFDLDPLQIFESDPEQISSPDPVQSTSATTFKDVVQSIPTPSSLFSGKALAQELDALPPCQRECAKTLQQTIAGALNNDNYVNKYHSTCAAYKDAKMCIAEQREICGENNEMFDVVTSGVHFMCIEQGKAFNATIKCIDRQALSVQGVCDIQCETKKSIMEVISKTSFTNRFVEALQLLRTESALHPPAFGDSPIPFEPDLFHFGPEPQSSNGLGLSNDLSIFQPDMRASLRDFEIVSAHACRVAECFLSCIRSKYDMMCENHAGMLISETLVRPLMLTQRRFSFPLMALGMMMPESCKFLSSGTRLLRHRIDPRINDNLLRAFGGTEEEELAGFAEVSKSLDTPRDDNSTELEAFGEEGSGQDCSQGICQSNGTLLEASGEQIEEFGESIFRNVLSTAPSYFEFTAKSSGSLRCRIVG